MRLLAFLLCLSAVPAAAVTCAPQTYDGRDYTVCTVRPAVEDLRLFLYDESGAAYASPRGIANAFPDSTLAFAMNAGMYHPDLSPVGYYFEAGREEMRLLTAPSDGNFGLLPNGVFCIGEGRADVIETLRFQATAPACRYATQSGPMLVIDGALHPRFRSASTSRYIRNGVGSSADGQTLWFVISDDVVTFYEFGSFFRDVLGARNALYFDGNVSRLHAPGIGRSDGGFAVGPMVGVLE